MFSLSSAFAQPPETGGKTQLSLHGSLDFQGPNGDNTDIQVGYGWYIDDQTLIGGEYRWSLIEDIAPGEDDYRAQQASFVAEWLFTDESALVPYIGGEIGFRNIKFEDLDESGLVYGGRLGLMYFLTESVAIDGSVSLLQSDKEVFIVDFEAEDQYLYPSFGLKALF
jgi:hypothetical protein